MLSTARLALRPALQPAAARLMATSAPRAAKSTISTPLAGAVAGGITLGVVGLNVYAKEPSVDYDAVRKDIAAVYDKDNSHGPFFIRLSWHSSGTYCKASKTGGSEKATMRFQPEVDHGANAGLSKAQALLKPILAQHPGLSAADLWVLAGTVAVEEMGGPAVGFTPGRTDGASGKECPEEGRLPDADGRPDAGKPITDEKNAQHIRDIFYRMGFNDQEIVCLSGAHAVGRCHEDRSGYWGPWTRAETTFSNEYFRELIDNKWTLKKQHKGKPWAGPEQYEDPTGELMMLPTDMALVRDPAFRKYTEQYAKDEEKFFKDFAKAFQKLNELGVKCPAKKGWLSWLGL
eukprot:g5723.t1